MPTLYVTPAAVGYLTQLILAAAITLYLASLLRRTTRRTQTALLLGFFAFTALFILLLFLDAVLPTDRRLYAVYLDYVVLALMVVCQVQFAYHFPQATPHLKREARIALVVSMAYAIVQAAYAVYRFSRLASGQLETHPTVMTLPMVIGLGWVPFVLLRQVVYASRKDLTGFSAPKEPHNLLGLYYLRHPRGQAARAARAFVLAYLSPLFIGVVQLLSSLSIISADVNRLSYSIGMLPGMFAIAVIYLNYLPEATSFVVKLVGATLTSVLMVLGTVGWVMTPAYAATFQPALPNRQMLRFSPNSVGGYDVTGLPFQLDRELGARLNVLNGDSEQSSAAVDFAFPFYGQTYSQVYVGDNGAVGLGQRVRYQNIHYRYGLTPAILPLYLDLDPKESQGGVFARQTADRLLLTWAQVPNYYQHDALFTFQVTLYASGVFEIAYDSLPANVRFHSDDRPEASVWLIGAVRGDPNRAPQAVDFARLPAQTGDQGFIEDVYLAFRGYLHQALLPLVLLILGSSLLICLALPVFIRYDLVKPLQELIQGVARVGQGDLEIAVPVRAADEIGFLANAFNAMVDSLRTETNAREQAEQRVVSLNIALARRVQDRTRDLKTLYEVTALANEAMDLPITLERELDKILELIGMDQGLVHLFDEDGSTLRLVAQRGFMPELIRKMQSWLPKCALLESVIATRKPVMVSDIRPDLPIAHCAFLGATPTYIGVPILLKERILGTFSVFDKDAQRLGPEELALLEAIAAQIGIVVESARLRRRAEQAAVSEERSRLAREMHDGLAQDLASLRLRVDLWQNLASTNPERLRGEFDRAKQILGNSIRDVRHSIFALRPLLLNEGGFFAAVEQFTTGFGEQHDLRVAWRVLGPRERLPSLWEPILIHIIQEALNNTSKHAHAKSVAITLDLESAACLALTIQDDGIGFDPNCLNEPLSGERRGLAQMREQVKRLDGTFRLRSLPGQGTEIRIILPWEQ